MSVNHAANAGQHSYADRGYDAYMTPACATRALLSAEQPPHWCWDPCAGRGAIAKVLRDAGHAAICSDIVERDFPLHFVRDFLAEAEAPAAQCVITNPPYRLAQQFVEHALDLVPVVMMLLPLRFLASERRTGILEGGKLHRVHIFRNRLPMMHRDGWTGPRASSSIDFAWFVWRHDHAGPITVDRITAK